MNVRTLCLAILYFGDATGYEIRKNAQEGIFSYLINASYGAIYPALGKLTKDGLVSCREEMQSGKPNKKIYTLTEAGRRAFIEALHLPPADDIFKSEFLLIMMCAELVEPASFNRLVDERLGWLDERVVFLKGVLADVEREGSRFAIGCGITAYENDAKHLRQNREKLSCIAGSALRPPRPQSDSAE